MIIKKILDLIIVIITTLTTLVASITSFIVEDVKPSLLDYKIQQIINSMSIEEKVGQMLMVSFYDNQLKDYAINKSIGGYILFSNNIKDYESIRLLTEKIYETVFNHNGIPPFIAIDHEGGIVSRLDHLFYPLPNAIAIGATNIEALAYNHGYLAGKTLSHLGINVNLAPVLDVNTDHRNPVIGTRSFGNDPEKVYRMGRAFVNGQKAVNIISCVKHFPGHGNVNLDSHYQLPINPRDKDKVLKTDILPFRKAAEDEVDMIMTAHIKVPKIDDMYVATLSKVLITDILRGEYHFDGVIITDDIGSMKAITAYYKTEEAAILAIEAGVDILLIVGGANLVNRTILEILAAVKNGRISEDRINESVRRILKLKHKNGLFSPQQLPDFAEINHLNYDLQQHSMYVYENALTLLKNEYGNIPLTDNRILFISQKSSRYKNPLTNEDLELENIIGQFYNNFDMMYYDDTSLNNVSKIMSNYNVIVVFSERGYRHKRMLWLMREFKKHPGFILVSMAEPYEPMFISELHTHMAIYAFQYDAIVTVLRGLKGEIEFRGENPVP